MPIGDDYSGGGVSGSDLAQINAAIAHAQLQQVMSQPIAGGDMMGSYMQQYLDHQAKYWDSLSTGSAQMPRFAVEPSALKDAVDKYGIQVNPKLWQGINMSAYRPVAISHGVSMDTPRKEYLPPQQPHAPTNGYPVNPQITNAPGNVGGMMPPSMQLGGMPQQPHPSQLFNPVDQDHANMINQYAMASNNFINPQADTSGLFS